MMWGNSFYLIFLFCYTNGQIKQVPIAQQQENGVNKLKDQIKGIASEVGGKFPLKGKNVGNALTAQWERDGEAVPRWPNGLIRYYVDPSSYGYVHGLEGTEEAGINIFLSREFFAKRRDSNIKSLLEAAFAQLSSHNDCPDFSQLDSEPEDDSPWLHFTNPKRVRDCVHDQGENDNGEIAVILGYDCLKPAQILHTILHGLGFRDEVTHPQRDLFVRIQWDNIQPAFRPMFRIQPARTAALLDYDPKSIMHFHDRAYTVNGMATIASLLPGLSIEPSEELSHLDKMKIRLAFSHECKKRQIDQILNVCGDQNKIGDGKKYETIVVPGKDVAGITPDNEEPVNPEDLIVVPGNDINPDNKQTDGDGAHVNPDNRQSGGDDDLIVPGNDINPDNRQSDGDGADVNPDDRQSDGDADLIVPGKDVKPEDDQEVTSGNDDAEVGPGNNEDDKGNLQSGSDDVVVPGSNVDLNRDKVTDNEMTSREIDDGEVDNEREPGIVIPGNDVDLDSAKDKAPAGGNQDELTGGNAETDDERERGVVKTGESVKLRRKRYRQKKNLK